MTTTATPQPFLNTANQWTDPRAYMDEDALALASRNGFPIVAAQSARKDHGGLAVGATIALLLGAITFWSLSGSRHVTAQARQEPVPSFVPAAYRPSAPGPVVTPFLSQEQRPRLAVVSPMPMSSVDHLHSPLVVFDASAASASALARPLGGPPAPTVGTRSVAPSTLSDNEAFAARVGGAEVETESASRIGDPANTITQGTLIAAVLETAIDSDLPGYARAVVSKDVRSFDGMHVLIPRSSRLIGQYKSGLAAGQTRVYVLWTRLIRPDGVTMALGSPSTDYAGASGLTGQVDGHFMKRFGSAMLLSVVGGLGELAGSGTSVVLSTGGSSAASVAAQRDAQIPPTIHVRQGEPIRIFTARDLDFSTAGGAGVGE